MIPDSLSESYEEYKADTKAFVNWLSHTAISRGYQFQPAQSTATKDTPARLKGKARKEAKKAQSTNEAQQPARRHVVSAKELLAQAESIASTGKPQVQVPLGIQYVLKRAINARRKCVAWFENLAKQYEGSIHSTSNTNHQHFISVLDRVFRILEPNFASSKLSKRASTRKAVADLGTADTNSPRELANRFQALKLEDLDQESVERLISEETNFAATRASTVKPLLGAAEAYELDAAEDEQQSFAVFCVFEELQKIRKFIQRTWKEVADGTKDQMAASLATNVALTLARKATESLIADLTQPLALNSYVIVLEKLEQSAGLIVTRKDQNLDVFYSDELTYYSSYCYLSNFTMNYQSCMKKGELAWVVPAHEDKIIGSALFSVERIAEDRMIAQMLHELVFQNVVFDGQQSVLQARRAGLMPPLLGEPFKALSDEIEQGLRSFMPTENREEKINIGLQAVFAARVLLDINRIMGSKAYSGWDQLRQRCANIAEALDFHCFDASSGTCSTTNPKGRNKIEYCTQEMLDWGSRDTVRQARNLAVAASRASSNSKYACIKNSLMGALKKPSSPEYAAQQNPILPSTDPCFLYKTNPVYCGLESLNLATVMDRLAFQQANLQCHFIGVAHIYNAAKQSGLIMGQWNDLETAINANIRPLFKGSLPITEQQIFQRLCLAMKVPAAEFDKNMRSPMKPISIYKLSDNYTLLERDELSVNLSAYFKGTLSAEQLLSSTSAPANTRSSPHGYKRQKLTNIQMLEQLLQAVSGITPNLNFDLVTLSRKCKELLVFIRAALKEHCGLQNMEGEREIGEYYEKQAFRTAADIIFESWEESQIVIVKPSKDKEKSPGSGSTESETKLHIAAKVIQSFLEEANTVVAVDPAALRTVTRAEVEAGLEPSARRNKAKIEKLIMKRDK